MGEAIGQILPMAVGVALSPLPIIAVVLMLTTPRARTNGPAFVVGWLIGLAVIGTIVLLVAGSSGAGAAGPPATWVSWVEILLGVLLLAVAVRQFRGRPGPGDDVQMPKWVAAVDRFTRSQSLVTGAALAGANPKNALLAIGAAVTIAQAGIGGWQQAIAYAVFAVIGTIGVGTPVVLYLAMGKRSAAGLAGLEDWMGRHSAAITSVLCLVIGVKLIGAAIGALT
jgi:threonine/homoserine/homoserine lactone efflux protein